MEGKTEMKEYYNLRCDVCGLVKTKLHDIKFQKIVLSIVTALRASYLSLDGQIFPWESLMCHMLVYSYITIIKGQAVPVFN
jgi:hypothetical protein